MAFSPTTPIQLPITFSSITALTDVTSASRHRTQSQTGIARRQQNAKTFGVARVYKAFPRLQLRVRLLSSSYKSQPQLGCYRGRGRGDGGCRRMARWLYSGPPRSRRRQGHSIPLHCTAGYRVEGVPVRWLTLRQFLIDTTKTCFGLSSSFFIMFFRRETRAWRRKL